MKTSFTALLSCFSVALAFSFSGKIEGVPDVVSELQKNSPADRPTDILNGLNYQSRFTISLFPLEKGHEALAAPLNRDYEFKFDHLDAGIEYQLLLNSHDFNLEANRYRVVVAQEEAEETGNIVEKVNAYKESLYHESYNISTGVTVTKESPLVVKFVSGKQYYEQKLGTLKDMVMNSPVGFIFANTMYTVTAAICLLLMVAPYALQYIAPEYAAELNAEVADAKAAGKSAGEAMAEGVSPSAIPQNDKQSSSGNAAGNAIQNARQRK